MMPFLLKTTAALKNLAQNRLLQHCLFWAFSFYVLARFFAYEDEVAAVDWIYTLLFHFSLWLAVYPNLIGLIPRFLQAGNYLRYFGLLAVVIFAAAGLNLLTFNYLSDLLFPGYYFIAYYNFDDILQFIGAYVAVTTLLKLSKGWFQHLETQRLFSRLEREKLDAELSALKAQVNPHFLFNSLNNLYSLALDRDERTPGIILRLSQMMRYLLHESNVPFVPLEKEIEHLQNFVEMQRLRTGGEVKVEFSVKGDPAEKQVAPLLFLPLVENGFKHGVKGDTQGTFIFIDLKILPNELIFKVENNRGVADEAIRNLSRELGNAEMAGQENASGVGLRNLRRRLELIYPGRHRLEVTEGIHVFTVVLTLLNVGGVPNPADVKPESFSSNIT